MLKQGIGDITVIANPHTNYTLRNPRETEETP